MPSQKKIDTVAELSEKTSRAKSMIFTNYQGLTHKQLEELKKALKALDAEFVVTKNTLLKKSVKDELPALDGPTATLFAYADWIGPIKKLAKSIKLFKLPEIKFGITEGKVVEAADIMRLSTLPSKEILLAQLVGGMKAPIYGLHRALNWNIQKLVMTLQEISNKKQVTSS